MTMTLCALLATAPPVVGQQRAAAGASAATVRWRLRRWRLGRGPQRRRRGQGGAAGMMMRGTWSPLPRPRSPDPVAAARRRCHHREDFQSHLSTLTPQAPERKNRQNKEFS